MIKEFSPGRLPETKLLFLTLGHQISEYYQNITSTLVFMIVRESHCNSHKNIFINTCKENQFNPIGSSKFLILSEV